MITWKRNDSFSQGTVSLYKDLLLESVTLLQ